MASRGRSEDGRLWTGTAMGECSGSAKRIASGSIGGDRNAKDQRFGDEIEPAVGLVAVQNTPNPKYAVLVGALLDPQKLAVPARRRGPEIDTRVETRDEKLALAELRDQRASDRPRIARRASVTRPDAVGHGSVPGTERERLRDLAGLLGNRLEFALKIHPSDLSRHRPDRAVIVGPRRNKLLRPRQR